MIQIRWKKYKLKFRFNAGTSRGILTEKDSYFIIINSMEGISGIGECGPLPGLSIDYSPDLEDKLTQICRKLSNVENPDLKDLSSYIYDHIPPDLPSIRMGFETAWRDLLLGGKRLIFENGFYSGQKIPINGLVWMGDKEFMLQQLSGKINEGFTCIKIKIGALELERELEVLDYIRNLEGGDKISIRVDANGAFTPENVYSVLDKLSQFNIHSIEQPIPPGQRKEMTEVCRKSPVPVALDEELIGINLLKEKKYLLEEIKPQFLVLKPSLLGGFQDTSEWIHLASEKKIGWWITSALESNVGLNAIAQFTANYPLDLEQGLGTGQIYENNFDSPLGLEHGKLRYDSGLDWDLKNLHIDHL